MKKSIHPTYHKAKIVCACGAEYEIGSTAEDINVELCSACHPFYTGKQHLVDTEGRVEKFKAKQEMALKKKEEAEDREKVKIKRESKWKEKVMSLKDLKVREDPKKGLMKKDITKKKSVVKKSATKKKVATKKSAKKALLKEKKSAKKSTKKSTKKSAK